MNRERDKKHKTEQRRVRNVKQKDGIVMPVPVSQSGLPHGYANLLASLKKRIQQERTNGFHYRYQNNDSRHI